MTEGPDLAASYCAVGALLRYAGVPRAQIRNAMMVSLDEVYGPLLRARYGIAGDDTLLAMMAANDGADSRAEAIWRVLGLAAGTVDPETFVVQLQVGGSYSAAEVPPAA
jgi:hypothetical protein